MLFDTQVVVERAASGDFDHVNHAMLLFSVRVHCLCAGCASCCVRDWHTLARTHPRTHAPTTPTPQDLVSIFIRIVLILIRNAEKKEEENNRNKKRR